MLTDLNKSWLLAVALTLCMGWGASAQEFMPFAPADLSTYGDGQTPNEGFFFTFDVLHWSISAPEKTAIGSPGLTRTVFEGSTVREETNSLDTGGYDAEFTDGQRFELGYVNGHHGWLFSAYKLTSQNQRITRGNVDVVFDDPPFGPFGLTRLEGFVDVNGDGFDDDLNFNLVFGRDGRDTTVPPDGEPDTPAPTDIGDIVFLPSRFDELQARNRTQFWSTEALYLLRTHQLHRGGYLEFTIGARYLNFRDQFDVLGFGGILDHSQWNTDAQNDIIGPQLGVRWARRNGRFGLSAEGRYMAGFNFQSIYQQGSLATNSFPGPANFPLSFGPTSFDHSVDSQVYSNFIELRLEASYQLTRALTLRIGWDGMYMDGIARASNMVNYTLPNMGILALANQQDVFVHGLTAGIEINR